MMIDRLPPAHLLRGEDNPRAQLDSELGVMTWTGFSATPVVVRAEPLVTDEGEVLEPPAWWHGDEEASQAFLRAQGVELD
jgi:hypothetical protein